MPPSPRIEELRRRIQQDPASIAFAQLAEEYRRSGQFTEAVDVCREGLASRPGYLSARITLGRALLALGQLAAAATELETVLAASPDNLGALRALAETRLRQSQHEQALECYRRALAIAPNDPDLERHFADVTSALAAATQQAAETRRAHAAATVAALERWLEAVRAARSHRLA